MTYTLERIESPDSPAFNEAYGALFQEFGVRGELEPRPVISRWLEEGARSSAGLLQSYHLITARDVTGTLAGVRDFHFSVDAQAQLAVVYLAHALVLPAYRRTGLGGVLRAYPRKVAEDRLLTLGMPSGEILLAAEMEPATRQDEESHVRLVAYGKDGFRALDPAAFPYYQPDFRNLEGSDGEGPASPLPLLAVVRWVRGEARTSLPPRLARAFLTHLYAVFATHVPAAHLRSLEEHTLERLSALASDEVPLLPLPRSINDRERLSALLREQVLPHFARANQ